MTDPDAFLIDRVFQPLVDRLELEPRSTAMRLHRVHIGGIITMMLLAWGLSFRYLVEKSATPSMHGPAMTPYEPIIYIVGIAVQMGFAHYLMRRRGSSRLNPNMVMTRIGQLIMSILLCCMAASVLVDPRYPVKVGMVMTLFVGFWLLGLVAIYIHACRPPPPPRDRASVRPVFGW
jgi:ABC-type transport system involved in cytochrome c biogenesis permease subunit